MLCGAKAPKFSRQAEHQMSKQFDTPSPSLLFLAQHISAMDKFFNDVQKANKKPTAESEDPAAPEKKAIPKGVVLGKDGKP